MSEGVRLEAAMSGMLALMATAREEAGVSPTAKKTEVLLRDAGLTNEEIGAVLGKKAGAVRMAIARAEAKE